MADIKVKTQQYVCFNKESGEIFSIGPNINSNYEHIEITDDQAKPFQTLKENFINWAVQYNKRNKSFELKKNVDQEQQTFLLNELYKPKDEFHDIEFVVDRSRNKCYVKTLDTPKNLNEITFYVTKKGDPHYLLNTFTFKIGSKEMFPFNNIETYSVYTKNVFADCVTRETNENYL
tara:strand:- start:23726 stop:24253 length:528 start_codon:yes stop_codon:yes gene_type:complete